MEHVEHLIPKTVGELLGLPAEPGLYVDVYLPGSEPSTPTDRTAATRARRLQARLLDPFLPEARAGATDAAIARAAKVKPSQVGRWRRARGVAHPRGRISPVARATTLAVELLGHPFEPVLTDVRTSVVGGRFEPPEYVLRDGLDYDLFVTFVDTLVAAGHDDEALALGLGVRRTDIELARALAARAP